MNTTFDTFCEQYPALRTIRDRRSIRLFRKSPVEEERVRMVIEAASRAPSAWNQQTFRFVILRDPAARRKIYESVLEKKRLENPDLPESEVRDYLGIDAPVQIFVLNDVRGIEDERVRRESRAGCYAATQNLLLAAHAIGLGACWQGDPLLAESTIREWLQVPNEVEVVSSVALGYPDEHPKTPDRVQALEDICFQERMADAD